MSGVDCGGHFADSCSKCADLLNNNCHAWPFPCFGNTDEQWCKGECFWTGYECIDQNSGNLARFKLSATVGVPQGHLLINVCHLKVLRSLLVQEVKKSIFQFGSEPP